MKIKRQVILKLLCLFLIGSISIIVIKYNGYIISRGMLSSNINIMSYSIARVITNQIPIDKRDINTKLEYINDYIYINVHSYGIVRDDGPSWMLIYGTAWCDSLANILQCLIEPINIRGYLVFLKLGNGASPHSVAYCTPENLSVQNVEYLQKNAVVIDPQNGIIYRNMDNKFATPTQLCNGEAYFPKHLSSHREFYCENPQIFTTNKPISTHRSLVMIYLYQNIFPYIPISWLKIYIKLALVLNTKLEKAERMYYLARVSQLFLDYSAAKRGYLEVVNGFPNTRWAKLALYWKNQISSPEKRFPRRER